MTEQWKVFEQELHGTKDGNPFREVTLQATFRKDTQSVTVNGFYCGDGVYKVRFMPLSQGTWRAVTSSNDPAMDGIEIICEASAPSEHNHGRVLRKSDVYPTDLFDGENENLFHFSYEDGTRFQPFGTTCYAWVNQPEEVQEKTLETLKHAPFNKVRMCIFPKFYTYNTENPVDYAFVGEEGNFDFERFNPVFWERFEKRVAQLDELGIQADIILLHPYDKWGFMNMDKEHDLFYLKYAVDRLCHYKNVWWSMANEFDLMPWKTVEDWEDYARCVMARDSYGHLRSIHNCRTLYDQTKPWITHVSLQRINVYETSEAVTRWREEYKKPIMVDECAYEGNINHGWGNLIGEEMTRRFWEGCIRGGYLSHGEVFVDRNAPIWWAHGGELYGDSPARIGFLKDVMADAPENCLCDNSGNNWDVPVMYKDDTYFLYYFGFFRPCFRTFRLPEGNLYEAELLDTWEMTIQKLGTMSGECRIDMPSKQYMAVRFRKIEGE